MGTKLKSFKDFIAEKAMNTPGKGETIFDVDGKKVGTVKAIKGKDNLVVMSNGDEVNSDSFYKEKDGKWVVEL